MTANDMLALLCPPADLDAERARMERSLALYALFFSLDRLMVGAWPGQPPRVVVLAEEIET